jgi:hypothetical protein
MTTLGMIPRSACEDYNRVEGKEILKKNIVAGTK